MKENGSSGDWSLAAGRLRNRRSAASILAVALLVFLGISLPSVEGKPSATGAAPVATAAHQTAAVPVLPNANLPTTGAGSVPATPTAAEDTTIWSVPVATSDPVRGSADALVSIVQFGDFECPFTKQVEAVLSQILAKYGSDVRIVWKDFPLPFHKHAAAAAVLARVAYQQRGDAGFWPVHDGLFASQPALDDSALQVVAGRSGIAWAQVKAAITKKTFQRNLDAGTELASDLTVRGTPYFFVNGYRVQGAQPFNKFQQVIDAQLAKARVLVSKGIARRGVYAEIMKDAKGPPQLEKRTSTAPSKYNATKGSPNAKVTIQIFSDFQCPFCKRVEPTLAQVEKEYTGKVQFVWRHLPLAFHAQANLAAQAAQEVHVQKGSSGFWAYHKKLFAAQDLPNGLERPNLEKLAGSVGANMKKFKTALDRSAHQGAIDADMAAAKAAGIQGTPVFLINGYLLNGAQPFASFKKVINQALAD